MSELVGAVTATARRWRVDTLPAARFLQVEDEIVEVQALYIADSIITVRRGIEGSTAASHADGTELEAPIFGAGAGGGAGVIVDNEVDPPAEVTTIIAPGATVGGGEADLSGLVEGVQTVRLLGPYHVEYDTEDISDGILKLEDIAANVFVISAFAVFTDNWQPVTTAFMHIWIGVNGDWELGNWYALTRYDAETSGVGGSTFANVEVASYPIVNATATPDNVEKAEGRVTAAGALGCWVEVTGGPPVQGAADIWFLIAEPAA